MTISLQLEGQGLEAFRAEAAALGITVDQLATEVIRRHIRAENPTLTADEATFRHALIGSVSENEELWRRLAR